MNRDAIVKRAKELLNTRAVVNDDGSVSVILYSTEILVFCSDGMSVRLNTGWLTLTAIRRMNQFLPKNVRVRVRGGMLLFQWLDRVTENVMRSRLIDNGDWVRLNRDEDQDHQTIVSGG